MRIAWPPDKSAYWNIIFFISHPKHMVWVLIRIICLSNCEIHGVNECPVVLIYRKYILTLTLCYFWELLIQFIIIPAMVFPGELLRTFTHLDLTGLEQLCSLNCLEGLLTFVF